MAAWPTRRAVQSLPHAEKSPRERQAFPGTEQMGLCTIFASACMPLLARAVMQSKIYSGSAAFVMGEYLSSLVSKSPGRDVNVIEYFLIYVVSPK